MHTCVPGSKSASKVVAVAAFGVICVKNIAMFEKIICGMGFVFVRYAWPNLNP